MLRPLTFSVICLSMLSACASTDPSAFAKTQVSVADALTAANAAASDGQRDMAINILQRAARAHPSDKAPWVRMAQLRYDAGEYGEAIVFAEQALQRDADDLFAHSVAAVSGLRVASKALSDLTKKQNLSGTVRSEAQDLTKLLRANLGEDVLVPGLGLLRPGGEAQKKSGAPVPPDDSRKGNHASEGLK